MEANQDRVKPVRNIKALGSVKRHEGKNVYIIREDLLSRVLLISVANEGDDIVADICGANLGVYFGADRGGSHVNEGSENY